MTEREALKLALEALEWINRVNAMEYEYQQKARESLNAIYEALAQPEQEPVAWMVGHRVYDSLAEAEADWEYNPTFENTGYVPTPLYTTPPQRKPLTDEEIALIVAECASSAHRHDDFSFARAIEAAHGIKGEA